MKTNRMAMEQYKSIALIDSGVGGLTVVKEIINQLPHENTVYFGDTAHMPYGPRPFEQVRGFVYEILDFLKTQEIKLVIIACNTAASAGLSYYQGKTDLPLLGVIEPGVRAALRQTKNNKIGVIGTTGTIRSGAYQDIFQRFAPEIRLYSQPCPLFVLIVENGLVYSPEAIRVAEEYLLPLKKAGVDTLILGCTHYPLLADVIGKVMGPGVKLISSAEETAREAKRVLEGKGILTNSCETISSRRFFVSGPAKPFADLAQSVLQGTIKVYQVILPW